MSITDAIRDMEKRMGIDSDFSEYMNAPLPHNNQGYVQRDYKTGIEWVMCPFCGKRQFPLTPGAHITGQKFKCKGSGCKQIFEVNIKNGREIK